MKPFGLLLEGARKRRRRRLSPRRPCASWRRGWRS